MSNFIKKHWFYLFLVNIIVISFFFKESLEWNRELILEGQVWRIITSNFSHFNLNHLLMNFAAFSGIYYFYYNGFENKTFLIFSFLISIIGGFLLFYTNYTIYNGMSALIHGLLGYLAISDIFKGNKGYGFLILIGISLKLTKEQIYGADKYITELVASNVAIESHLIYFFVGISLALIHFLINKKTS